MEFIMTVGLAGSGKTTWAYKYAAEHDNYAILDSDEIRAELWEDAEDQRNPAKVFDTMYRRTCNALVCGKSVIYCATNLSMKRRIHLVKQLRAKFPKLTLKCIVFNTPIAICKEWNMHRTRQVPEYVFDRQARAFQFPVENEGWDAISIISPTYYDTVSFSNQVWRKVKAIGSQDNPHHTLTLEEHLNKTVNKVDLSIVNGMRTSNMMVAANLHDVGKAYTRSYDESGIAHYYGHDNYGAYIAMNMGASMQVIPLINYHMLPFNPDGIKVWRERLGEKLWANIMILHRADKAAH